MMQYMNTKLLIYLMVLFSACTSYPDKRLEYALELASENRQELEKVLEHYQNDQEKLIPGITANEAAVASYG